MKRNKYLLYAAGFLTVMMCAALCLSVLALYRSGMAVRAEAGSVTVPVFTREAVVRRLRALSPLAGVWLVAVIAAVVSGRAPAASRSSPEPEPILRLLDRQLGDVPPESLRERKYRKIVRAVSGGVIALGILLGLIWLLNRRHFQSWDLEAVMSAMLIHILPPLILGLGSLMVSSSLCDRSRRREIALLRETLRGSPSPSGEIAGKTVSAHPGTGVLRAALYAAAAVLIVLGALNGGLRDVLIKAINICTECIGLG